MEPSIEADRGDKTIAFDSTYNTVSTRMPEGNWKWVPCVEMWVDKEKETAHGWPIFCEHWRRIWDLIGKRTVLSNFVTLIKQKKHSFNKNIYKDYEIFFTSVQFS